MDIERGTSSLKREDLHAIPDDHGQHGQRQQPSKILGAMRILYNIITPVLVIYVWYQFNWTNGLPTRRKPDGPFACHPPLPAVARFLTTPTGETQFLLASAALHAELTLRTTLPDIDSLSIAVVTPTGVVFQQSYGSLKANETLGRRGKPDKNSLYRVASISKLFNVFQMQTMRQQGLVSWDDPVNKHLPNFTYYQFGWAEYLQGKLETVDQTQQRAADPITLRQLASHMGGIGRDYPPLSVDTWPVFDPRHLPNFTSPSAEEVIKAIESHPLTTPQYTYPTYSNAGFNLLGYTLVAAANASSYPELLQKGIFDPLNLSSTFSISSRNVGNIVVPLTGSTEADIDFKGANPAGGQWSSLNDLVTVMQTFLDPQKNNSLLSPYTMREWLRPLHVHPDGLTEVGAPWEIIKLPDSNGIQRRFFKKGGNLSRYHSNFMFNPDASFGVVVLMTGLYPDATSIAYNAIRTFQAAFDHRLARRAVQLYEGYWQSDDLKSIAVTEVDRGTLWLKRLVLDGIDVFAMLEGPKSKERRYAIWSTGRADEFRVAVGSRESDDNPMGGCEASWIIIDPFYSRGAPVDLLLFEGNIANRVLRVPSTKGVLKRRLHR
ncbi:hypothetical protein FRB99_004942 [Tulasnella sp. 403]|nr:hypothetical protein FRB99_004942 [Tulasnella sp. 403]